MDQVQQDGQAPKLTAEQWRATLVYALSTPFPAEHRAWRHRAEALEQVLLELAAATDDVDLLRLLAGKVAQDIRVRLDSRG